MRAVQALGLLAGFYLIAMGALAAIVGFDLFVLSHLDSGSSFVALKLVGLSVLVAIPLVRGVFLVRRPKDEAPPGISVTEQQQPELWARVRGLAAQVGTRAPDEIRMIPAVNAAVSENPRFLGLVPGHRRMLIGVPLLLGLTEPQLDAVLAHELGHYSNRDTRLAGITVRGRQSLHTVVEHARANGRGITAALFTWYAKLYFRVSESVGRRQELAADLAAARIAGRDHAAGALRQVPALDAAYDYYLDRYASAGWEAGLLPLAEEFYGGFRSMLSSPKRQQELDGIRQDLPARETTPYDSHPPMHERVAALEALPGDGRSVTGTERQAAALVRDIDQLFAAVAATALSPKAAGKRPVGWDELAAVSGRASLVTACAVATKAARSVWGRPLAGLTDLLDRVDQGRLDAFADALPKSESAAKATGRAAREFARTAARTAVRPLVQLELLDAGRAAFVHSWDDSTLLRFHDPALDDALTAALDALVATPPDTAPLRAVLDAAAPPSSGPAPDVR